MLLLLITALFVVSAFFAAAETGFVASSEDKLFKMSKEGNANADVVTEMMKKKESVVSAALLGNNVVNTVISALATVFAIEMAPKDSDIVVTIAAAVIALAIFIFCEVLPKAISLQNPEKISTKLAPLFKIFVFITHPILVTTNMFVGLLLKLFGMNNKEHLTLVSPQQELKMVVEMKHKQGKFVKHERDMLDGVLELDEVAVREIMQHRGDVEMIELNMSIEDLIQKVMQSRYSRLPVYNGSVDNIVGILHVRDFLTAFHQNPHVKIKDVVKPPFFVSEGTSLKVQLAEFRRTRSHLACVVDEYGGLMGIVTLEDLIEEIIGNIEDERDKDEDEVTEMEDGSFLIVGDYQVRDFARRFNLEIEDHNIATVAGLIIEALGRLPKIGEGVDLCGHKLTIHDTERNKIKFIKMTKIDPEADKDNIKLAS